MLGELAVYVKYAGAAYLIWLAYITWKSEIVVDEGTEPKNSSLISNVFVGLFIGLSNPKAILFYMGFFPAFIELSSIGAYEVLSIILIATISVGGVLGVYACAGSKARYLFRGYKAKRILNRLSSGMLASCGALLAVKA
ncbi:MAG: LysE family translocator [Amphritea sp.]